MRASFFGDSYDLAKRFFLATLKPMGPWAVHPMFTSENGPLAAGFPSDFERLLGARLIDREVLGDVAARRASLAKCDEAGNLLLDPDTGLRLPKAKRLPSLHHVECDELVRMVRARPGRLTLVFDQAFSRGQLDKQLKKKLEWFEGQRLHGCAFRSHACFVFVACEPETIQRAVSLLAEAGVPAERFVLPGWAVSASGVRPCVEPMRERSPDGGIAGTRKPR